MLSRQSVPSCFCLKLPLSTLKGSCATFLLNSDDVVYIFGGQNHFEHTMLFNDVIEYIITEEKYNYVTELPMPTGLHKHSCTANVDDNGDNVKNAQSLKNSKH